MDDVHCIPFRQTGFFSGLICDYLDQHENVKPFYHRFPDLENFEGQMAEKKSFPSSNRKVLADALEKQYALLNKPTNGVEASLKNIELLRNDNTFTVTTGHQLSLFTGPLYFIYKIVSAINLAKKLKKRFPNQNFVPVYWMASEDHDFAEINHIPLSGGRLSWDLDASGPVGRLNTSSLKEVLNTLAEANGLGKNAEEINSLLELAYLGHSNLADATRYLVHELFGDKGLVIVDADDAELKRLVLPYFKQDLLDQLPFQKVGETSEQLGSSYFNQVHAREVNLFYIKDGLRERIEREGDRWTVVNTNIRWTKEELETELHNSPECFSPNVILRPLYQEVILPNLAYIGGGGEIAYWFQLKDMFDVMKVPFPMLMLRNSVLGISDKQETKLAKLEMKHEQLFQPVHKIQNGYAAKSAPIDPSLDPYEQKLEQMFTDLEQVAKLTDRSMLGAVNAQRQKQLNGLDNLKKKLLRAEKRKNSDLMDRIAALHGELFPNGSLQERHDNFTTYYSEYGKDWLSKLYTQQDPLKFEFIVANWS